MRKLNYLIIVMMIATGLFMTSCEKDQDIQKQQTSEVSFGIDLQADLNFKDGIPVPQCIPNAVMDHVVFILGGTTYTSPVIWVDGMPKTQAVKLYVNTDGTSMDYVLTSFLVYDANNVLIMAAPAYQSTYWDLMVNKLDITITVEAFKKQEVIIDVLCFEALLYQYFGFVWFELNEVVIERQCWFGDICVTTETWSNFVGSDYEYQENGIQMDMPMLMKIEMWKKVEGQWVLLRTFSNEGLFAWNAVTETYDGLWAEGACLEVYWANDLDLTEEFKLVVLGLLPDGAGLSWQQAMDPFYFTDGNCPDPDEDGVNDFVIGDCAYTPPDYVLPCWANLPDDAFYLQFFTASLGTYLDIELTDVPANYDVTNGLFGSWCADGNEGYDFGVLYPVKVASSSSSLPPYFDGDINDLQMKQLNYLFNHLNGYATAGEITNGFVMPDFSTNFSVTDMDNVQDAVWYILGDGNDNGYDWGQEAIDNATMGDVLLEGQYYVVIFYDYLDPITPRYQLQLLPVPCQIN